MNRATAFMNYTGENCNTPLSELVKKASGGGFNNDVDELCNFYDTINSGNYEKISCTWSGGLSQLISFDDYDEIIIFFVSSSYMQYRPTTAYFNGYRLYKLTPDIVSKLVSTAIMTYPASNKDDINNLEITAYIPGSGTSSYEGTTLGYFRLYETGVQLGQNSIAVIYGKPKVS